MNAETSCAHFYARRDKVFVLSVWSRPQGDFTQDDPIVASMDQPAAVGAAIQDQLRAFRHVPSINPGWQLEKPTWPKLCAAAGVKSHATFFRTAALGSVRSTGGMLTFMYWQQEGRGRVPDLDSEVSLPSDCSNLAVGRAALSVVTGPDEA